MARNTATSRAKTHVFSEIPHAEIQRSSFNRSSNNKTTFDAGNLVPIFCDEALPGDTFNMNMSLFSRLTTLLEPLMDNLYIDVFFFAVPNRLLWVNWEKFNGAQTDPGDSTDFLIPTMSTGVGLNPEDLGDYLGIPILVPGLVHSSMFHRGYNLIYNDWFRDENLQDSVVVDTDDGPDTLSDYVILKRGKRHDYFTSCLPFPQKGASVDLPIGSSAPVTSTGDGIPLFELSGTTGVSLESEPSANDVDWSVTRGSTQTATWDDPKLVADLSSATAATINDIRQAFQIQRLLERDARGGTRYTEILKAHFGVTSPDQRLQRPEYLGGGTVPMLAQAVPNTTSVGGGSLAAYAIADAQNIRWTKSFVEHCIIIGLISARADLNYQTGLDRMFSRSTRFDYYWPALSHLGEQTVLNKEIYAEGSDDLVRDAATFGFQERYAEYRYKPNQITGHMRSLAPVSLDQWHLSQELVLPVLNTTFIQENPPMDRVIALPGQPQFLLDAFFNLRCARPMPTYSVPGMIDHF